MQIEKLIRPDILKNFAHYQSNRCNEMSEMIYLDANENPYLNQTTFGVPLNRYPEKQPNKLMQRLADLYDIPPENLLLTRGSDEIIELLIRLFCYPDRDAIITFTPTFGMYKCSAQLQAINVIEIELTQPEFLLDVDFDKSVTENVKLIFICSPNNPTGNCIPRASILEICDRYSESALVVVDEAYIEYAGQQSFITELSNYHNIAIMRTLSKAYGLAGLRCGILIANPHIISWVDKIIAPYPVPISTTEYCLQAMNTNEFAQKIQEQILVTKQERSRISAKLQNLPIVDYVWPSDANFVLVRVKDAEYVFKQLRQARILVRMFKQSTLKDCLRITVGSPEENNYLLTVLASC